MACLTARRRGRRREGRWRMKPALQKGWPPPPLADDEVVHWKPRSNQMQRCVLASERSLHARCELLRYKDSLRVDACIAPRLQPALRRQHREDLPFAVSLRARCLMLYSKHTKHRAQHCLCFAPVAAATHSIPAGSRSVAARSSWSSTASISTGESCTLSKASGCTLFRLCLLPSSFASHLHRSVSVGER